MMGEMAWLIVSCVLELLMVPVIVFVLNHIVGKRLDKFDDKRDEARMAQAEAQRRVIEQREAERTIVLAMARTMLLDNYEKCMAKGYYTTEERDVYGLLYQNYIDDGGNSVIETLAPRIRALPTEPPKESQR